MSFFKSIVQKFVGLFGYRFQSLRDAVMDRDIDFNRIYKLCKPFTYTTKERMFSLYESVKYIVKAGIEGDFVECGVWRGGSVMVMALTLKLLGENRKIWLYDTFEGMPPMTKEDYHVEDPANRDDSDKAIGTIDEVKTNVFSTGYKNFDFVRGKVESTIPGKMPEKISILRLDTDWYASTKHELDHLYPILSKGGVLVVDDYAAWAGAKKAVDEYFNGAVLLNRIDHDSRLAVKI